MDGGGNLRSHVTSNPRSRQQSNLCWLGMKTKPSSTGWKNTIEDHAHLNSAMQNFQDQRTCQNRRKYQRPGCCISRALDFDSPALVLGFGELPCGISNRHMSLLLYIWLRLFHLAGIQTLESSLQPSKA